MLRAVKETLSSCRPDGGVVGGGDVGEEGGAEEHGCGIVRPLVVIDTGAVHRVTRAIIDVVVAVHQPNPRHPVVRLLRPVAVGAIPRIASQTRGELEEAAVRNGGFVVESSVVGVELPLQPSVAGGCIPAGPGHVVEDAFGEIDVGDVGRRGEWKGTLGGCHGGEAPEGLVIVTLCARHQHCPPAHLCLYG